PHARAADAAAHRAGDSVDLADARPGARADAALGHGARDGARGGLVPHLARGAGATVADVEVEQEGARHVRDDGRACGEADAALLEPPHHAVDRLLAEPAAAAQDGAVDRRDEVAGVEVVEADDVVGAAAQRDAARRGAVAQDDRDAGEADRVRRVPDAESRDVCDHFSGGRGAGAIGGWRETRRGPAPSAKPRFTPRGGRGAGAIGGWRETRRGPAPSAKPRFTPRGGRGAGAIGGWRETRRGPAPSAKPRFTPRGGRGAGAIGGWRETRRGPAPSAKPRFTPRGGRGAGAIGGWRETRRGPAPSAKPRFTPRAGAAGPVRSAGGLRRGARRLRSTCRDSFPPGAARPARSAGGLRRGAP